MSLKIYTIFNKPLDYPDHYVVRGFSTQAGEVIADEKPLMVTKDLEEIRRRMESMGLICLNRDQWDDPYVVESWI